ncbi:MAG: hypothetical protein QOJ49_462, partial [Actinomycetota bacterium]|nr:hypothetical protein [Actinomycetota bacterium]
MAAGRTSTAGAVWATRAVFAGNGALFAGWVSRIPAVRDRLHADERGLGFALLFAAIGSLVAMPLAGRLIARFGDRVVIAMCVGLCLTAYPMLAVAPNLVLLAVALFFAGAGVGLWDVAMNVAGHAVEEEAGRPLMPGFHAFWSLGSVVGAGIGALAARIGLSPLVHFLLAGALVGVLAVLAIRRLPDSQAEAAALDAQGEHHVPVVTSRPVLTDPR